MTEVGNAYIDDDDGQQTTALDRFEVMGDFGELKAHMSSQDFCGMAKPVPSHIIYEIFIRDGGGELQCVQALIDCSTTSIFIAPKLQKWINVADEPA